jgi:hypothetical protein
LMPVVFFAIFITQIKGRPYEIKLKSGLYMLIVWSMDNCAIHK